MKLLRQVSELLAEHGMSVGNVDVTVVAEQPKLAEHISKMRDSLCRALGMDVCCVSIKATTSEGLGFTGEGKGIAAWAVATVESAEAEEE